MIKVKFKSNGFKVTAKAINIDQVNTFNFKLLVFTDRGQRLSTEDLDEYVLSEILEESLDKLQEEYYNNGLSF